MKKQMPGKPARRWRNFVLVLLVLVVTGGLYWASRARQSAPGTLSAPGQQESAHGTAVHDSSPQTSLQETKPVPPYWKNAAAAKPFPRLLPASYFRNYPLVARAYQIASEIPEVIVQQPCYCYCDQFGHGSLLDCYASEHGAG